jgi:methionyl-tRNA formyltransferase
MRVIFAGTPAFAAAALEAILAAGHVVPLVMSQPDRPAGRGMKPQMSAVKQLALQHGVSIFQPERLKDPATHAPISAARPDIMVVAAYGLILPQAVLDIPAMGCLNIHASLLPRWRGAAPIQRAIEAGDTVTGVNIMQMEAGLDTGPTLLVAKISIANDDTAATLHDKLAVLGAQLIVEALSQLGHLSLTPQPQPQPQPQQGITYAHKIEKTEAVIDWRRNAIDIDRQIRAFNPFPGAVATIHGSQVKLWHSTYLERSGQPGTVLSADANGIVVAAGQGAIRVLTLQKPGGKRLSARDFLGGFSLNAGDRFDVATD